jgi:catechol 2,3-dioxygenase-like lactoylglutathione lyase family enzyme
MNHTGFVVKDLEKTIEFYRDVIGLELTKKVELDGGPIDDVVGYRGANLLIALLSVGDGHSLELIQYISPPGSERPTDERNAHGATHLAFDVDDIEQTFERLVSRGAHRLNPPIKVRAGVKCCYLQDPDGNWIELLETSG